MEAKQLQFPIEVEVVANPVKDDSTPYDDWDGELDEDNADDEDEPCGNLYAPGSEECDFCKFSDECYSDYLYFIKREERKRR